MISGKRNRFNLPNHVSVMNITAALAIGALSVAAYMMVTEPFQNYEAVTVTNNIEKQPTEIEVSEQDINQIETNSDLMYDVIEDNTHDSKELIETITVNSSDEVKAIEKNTLTEDIESFDASCYDGTLVFDWVTTGKANHQFEIEKSYDRKNFEVFARAAQPIKEDGKNLYHIEESIPANDIAYYRLRKKINKKKYEYSDEIQVECVKGNSGLTEIDVFPNGYGSFRIIIDTKLVDTFEVTLYDMDNVELVSNEFHTTEGSNEFVLNSNSISRGEYSLKVTNGKITKEKKVVLK